MSDRVVITKARVGYRVRLEPEEGLGTQGYWRLTLRLARRLGHRMLHPREPRVVEVLTPSDPNESYGYICRRDQVRS